MDPGPENHLGPQQQFVQYMEDGQHYQDDADMPVQENEGSEHSYETDRGTDSDEDLHCGAEPYWVDVAAQTGRGCSDECPAGIISEDFLKGANRGWARGPQWNKRPSTDRREVQKMRL